MITMKKQTAAIAVTAGVWAAAASAAAVLVYDLNRPLMWAGAGAQSMAAPLVSALVAGGWLAAFLWWRRKAQVARQFELVYARIADGLSGPTSRRPRPYGRDGAA